MNFKDHNFLSLSIDFYELVNAWNLVRLWTSNALRSIIVLSVFLNMQILLQQFSLSMFCFSSLVFCHFINCLSLFRLWSKCKRLKSQAKNSITLLESLYFRCFLYFCKTEINKICQIRKRFLWCQLICLRFNFSTFMNDQQLNQSFWLRENWKKNIEVLAFYSTIRMLYAICR